MMILINDVMVVMLIDYMMIVIPISISITMILKLIMIMTMDTDDHIINTNSNNASFINNRKTHWQYTKYINIYIYI